MKITKRKLSIITLVVTLLLSLALLFGVNAGKSASAEGTVPVNNNSVFTASGATVAGSAVGEGDTAEYYSTFTFTSDDDRVSYRRNVAYNWFEEVPAKDEDGKEIEGEKKLVNGRFNMEIGFKSTSFEKFVITFESQQYNKTKDGKTKNYVMFFPGSADGKVLVWITDNEDDNKDSVPEDKKVELNSGYIYIEFKDKYTDSEKLTGGYNVEVHDADESHGTFSGKFENVSGNYAKYSGSSTSPIYPLIFEAKFAENSTAKAEMVMFAFNGQAFKTLSSSSNSVTDDTAPVLCLEQDFKYFELNGDLDLGYEVIDVLRSSSSLPKPTVYYYLLEYNQTVNEDIKDYNDKDLYKETKTASDVLLEADKSKYMPLESDLANTAFAPSYITEDGNLVANKSKEKPVADMLIKVYFKLTDSSSSGETSEVSLDWYMDDNYKVKMTKGENTADFIAVAKDNLGVTYSYGDGWQAAKDAYQNKVTELAKNISAGSSSYMYLPSPENLFAANETSYTDMKFSIYYFHDSKQSSTNLSSSNLSINVTKEATYTFTIYATDASGNDMYYLDEVTDEAEKDIEIGGKYYKYVEFSAGDIWTMYEDENNEGLRDKLPWFEFTAGYNGVEFEETPGMQSTAYVGTSYSFSGAFKINGISGSYTTNYRLFRFNSAKYYKEHNNATFTYEEFIEKMDSLFDNPETHIYFEEIYQVSETDANYEDYKDYAWSNSSTSFVPQDANTFYYVLAEAKDTGYNAEKVTCSLAISASETAKTIKGESDWLKNNVASVVLLTVAVVALIGIVLLLVIKPKDKGDVDVQLEKAKKKEKRGKE